MTDCTTMKPEFVLMESLEPRLMLSSGSVLDSDVFPFTEGARWDWDYRMGGVHAATWTHMDSWGSNATIYHNSSHPDFIPTTETFYRDDTGTYLTEQTLEWGWSDVTMYVSDLLFLPHELTPGQTYTSSGVAEVDAGAITFEGMVTGSGKVGNWTQLSVPAGTFSALAVSVTWTFKGEAYDVQTVFGHMDVMKYTSKETSKLYFVPGIGMAKQVQTIRATISKLGSVSSKATTTLTGATGVPGAKPDLSVAQADYTAGTYDPGDALDVGVTEFNGGSIALAAGTPVDVDIILSTDRTWGNADDIAVGGVEETGGLKASQTIQTLVAGSIPADAPAGEYYVGVRIDGDNAVSELDESDNTWWSGSADVKIRPQLWVLCVGSGDEPLFGVPGFYFDRVDGEADAAAVWEDLQVFDGWAPDNPPMLYLAPGDTSAKSDLISAVANMDVTAGDQFVFYYSGHGGRGTNGAAEQAPGTPKDEFLVFDAGANPQPGTYISDDEFASLFSGGPWDQIDKLFLLDTCYSEGFWGHGGADEGDLDRLPRTAVLAAAEEDGYAGSDLFTGRGIWTGKLLDALQESRRTGAGDFTSLAQLIANADVGEYANSNMIVKADDFSLPAERVVPFEWAPFSTSTGDFAMDLSAGERIAIGGKAKAVFTDDNGDIVTVSLSGPGAGTVILPTGGAGDAWRIELSGTTDRSSLKIATKGGAADTTVGEIAVMDGSLKAIVAKTTDIVGAGVSTVGDGAIGSIVLRDMLNGADIDLPGAGVTKGVSITGRCFDDGSDVVLGSPLKSLKLARWGDGALITPWAVSLSVKGDKKTGVGGDFGSDITATAADPAKGVSLGRLTVAGSIVGADIALAGAGGAITAAEWTGGSLDATWVKSVTIKGDGKNPAINGDLNAEITLDGQDAKGLSLGKLSVAGAAVDSVVRTTGSMGALTLGATDGSDFLAGIAESAGRRAGGNGDFENPDAFIKSVKIKGWRVAKGETAPRFYRDSNFSAASLGAVSLLNIAYANADESFGLFAREQGTGKEIKAVTYKDTVTKESWRWPLSPLGADIDFEVAIL